LLKGWRLALASRSFLYRCIALKCLEASSNQIFLLLDAIAVRNGFFCTKAIKARRIFFAHIEEASPNIGHEIEKGIF